MWANAGMVRVPLFLAISVLTLLVGGIALLHDDGRLAEGISIQGVEVGGMSREEAHAKLERALASKLPPRFLFQTNGNRWTMSNGTIGRHLDYDGAIEAAHKLSREGGPFTRAAKRLELAHRPVQLPLLATLDRGKLESRLKQLAPLLADEPENARVISFTGSEMAIRPARDGLKLNSAKTLEAAEQGGRLPAPEVVNLVLDHFTPKVQEEDLRRDLNTVLAQYRTNMYRAYDSPMRENRRTNVELCLPRFRGVVLAPGEEFSFNGVVGERKAEDGFKRSIVFKRKGDGSIEEDWESGGGICQLATTMFDAVLLADLKITERNNHSKPVSYSKIARDATVYYGGADLKFVNSLTRPVMLWGHMDDWDLVVTVVGDRRDKLDVDLISESWTGRAGYGGTLWRSVKSPAGDTVKQREWICDSFYPYDKKPTD